MCKNFALCTELASFLCSCVDNLLLLQLCLEFCTFLVYLSKYNQTCLEFCTIIDGCFIVAKQFFNLINLCEFQIHFFGAPWFLSNFCFCNFYIKPIRLKLSFYVVSRNSIALISYHLANLT